MFWGFWHVGWKQGCLRLFGVLFWVEEYQGVLRRVSWNLGVVENWQVDWGFVEMVLVKLAHVLRRVHKRLEVCRGFCDTYTWIHDFWNDCFWFYLVRWIVHLDCAFLVLEIPSRHLFHKLMVVLVFNNKTLERVWFFRGSLRRHGLLHDHIWKFSQMAVFGFETCLSLVHI